MGKKILKYILIVIGLYVLYFVTGIVLTETKVVKQWWIAPNAVLADHNHDEDDSRAGWDGPHVFYHDSLVIISSVVQQDTAFKAVTDTFYHSGKDSIVLHCSFPGKKYDFVTRFRQTLNVEESIYPQAEKIFVVSDIEGNYEAFYKLLTGNKIMDSQYNWTFGSGHLVLTGDFFDRGLNVTECLWLIYDLEQKALQANGKVHFILGNHEIMNTGGDLRYVRHKYFENAKLLEKNYRRWYTLQTELGRWLASKNVAERVGDYLFVHGGFSEELNELQMPLPAINDACRRYYFTPDSIRRVFEGKLKILFGSKTAPFWYRGYVQEKASEEQVERTLQLYNAKKIIVGHTVVDEIRTLYDGKIIAVDTKHADGIVQALLLEAGKAWRVNDRGEPVELK